MKCPRCGSDASGKFCGECGTPLVGATCSNCTAKLLPGARFCTQCGTLVRVGRLNNAGWYAAGAALIVLAGVVLIPMFRGSAPATTSDAQAGRPANGMPSASPPPLTGTRREQADRLFNRVMQAREEGDTAQARFFVPMAITAYQSAGELDADGRYHLSVLQTFAGDPASGQATAESILVDSPRHLLGLHAAASAALAQNDEPAARRYYQTLLNALPQERSKSLPEYQDHAALIPGIEAEAKAFLKR